MKNFIDRVKRDQEKHEGLQMFKLLQKRHLVDLVGINQHGKATLIRCRNGGHGRLNQITLMKLQQLGKKCNAKVLSAKENGAGEIVFIRIYGY